MPRTEAGLTPQQEAFAIALSTGKSQAAAYREAYPRSKNWKTDAVYQAASHLASDPKVSARVAELRARVVDVAILQVDEILTAIRSIALSDPANLLSPEGKLLPPNEIDKDTRRAIASIEVDEFGRIKYKFWDKNAALDKAAKILGLYEKDNRQKAPELPVEIRLVPLLPEPKQ